MCTVPKNSQPRDILDIYHLAWQPIVLLDLSVHFLRPTWKLEKWVGKHCFKTHYDFHNTPPWDPDTSQKNPVHVLKPCFFKIYFYAIRQSTPRSLKWSLPAILFKVLRISHLSDESYLAPVIALSLVRYMCSNFSLCPHVFNMSIYFRLCVRYVF